jgi:hypothetical protein
MNIIEATNSYEKWLGQHLPLVSADIALKHERMAEDCFQFLRATFYRWVQHWDEACTDLKNDVQVLAVGDLHVENFGTWRDLDGRLIWGINDYDEAFTFSYAIDLVRLGVSAQLAIREGMFNCNGEDAIEAILDGYEDGFEVGGLPFVLEEHHRWLRQIALSELRDPILFWKKTRAWEPAKGKWVSDAQKALKSALPDMTSEPNVVRRIAGLGSLGRPRFAAVVDCHGGKICREAKALAPSAGSWVRHPDRRSQHIGEILACAKRVPDPIYYVKDKWLIRRLAPHCSKIELTHLPKRRDELELLRAMGFETSNIHLGSLNKKQNIVKKKWRRNIRLAIDEMTELTLEDFRVWRRHQRSR